MVNEEKVRIMTKLASFEKGVSKDEIREGGLFKSDYIRSHLIVTIWSYSVAFILILFLLGLYYFDYLVSDAGIREIRSLAIAIAAIYVLVLLCCIFFTVTIYSSRYQQTQKKRKEYYNELKRLEAFYVQSREGGNG